MLSVRLIPFRYVSLRRRLLHQYRTADFLDYKYPRGANLNILTGGNMMVRREVLFAEVGMFDKRLGPGGFAVSEDVEFATRVFRAGRRLVGSQPSGFIMNWIQAVFAKMSFGAGMKPGRSRLAYKSSLICSIIPNLRRSIFAFSRYSCLGTVCKKYRSNRRCLH